MENCTIVSWDWKAQPDWPEINRALGSVEGKPVIVPVETKDDQFAVVVGPEELSYEGAQTLYDEMLKEQV